MKSCFLLLLLAFGIASGSQAQSTEAQQLLLNVEKLSQLKNILEDMKKGYQIVSEGYSKIKNIAQGNFSLHEVFLDGLLLVNPEIKKYHRIADIITDQKDIVSEYKTAYKRFVASGNFNENEIRYLNQVYSQLTTQSLRNLDDLTTVITSSQLRMSDDERLQAIDRIFEDTRDKLNFLRHFNRQASLMNLQREKEKADVQSLKQIYQP
ncbi:TerB family tellurite resistance protein [Arcticibacter tournemirensis]|uniref:TerB family tellurite resistance protein n=2 Tax=Arcticibacter tournemirensis TaxID=699437 RepID=A0A5M9H1Y8_9SPHI|nr:TerB family tellurite resistance protein [Arcticibacter tournemirensis]